MQKDDIKCGNGIVKLYGPGFDQETFNEKTRYLLMFGPDKCNSDPKVRFVLQTKNPKTNEWSAHELQKAPKAPYDNLTHLYTLVITPQDTYRIKVDNRVAVHIHLLREFSLSNP